MFDISAYCFMPDHVHLIIEAPAEDANLRGFMNGWKQRTAYAHSRLTGERLWQHGYYDHVLRADEDRLDVIAYVVTNPWRAGLVEDLREYPFWGSGVWSRNELLEAIQNREVK